MTEKELKKLSRLQLFELLIIETEENEKLRSSLAEKEANRAIETYRIADLGSVAEAALQISGVLNAAQMTADIYLSSAKKRAKNIIKRANEKADAIIRDAKEKAKAKGNRK